MDTKEWARIVAAGLPVGSARVLLHFAPRLKVDFPTSAFTADTARAVGKRFVATPDYEQLSAALRFVMPAPPAGGYASASTNHAGGSWGGYVARRLAEGADRLHLLSLLRAKVPPDQLRSVMAEHFPAELAEAELEERQKAADRARAAEYAAGAEQRQAAEAAYQASQRAAAAARFSAEVTAFSQELAASTKPPPGPAKPSRAAVPPEPPPPEPPPEPTPREIQLRQLAEFEGLIAAGKATEATKFRAEILRRRLNPPAPQGPPA